MRIAIASVGLLLGCGSSAPTPKAAATTPVPQPEAAAPAPAPAKPPVAIPDGSCCCEFTYDVEDGNGGAKDFTHAAVMALDTCKASAGTCLAADKCTE